MRGEDAFGRLYFTGSIPVEGCAMRGVRKLYKVMSRSIRRDTERMLKTGRCAAISRPMAGLARALL